MAEVWPFTRGDWQKVSEAGRDICNACLADDEVLRASKFEDLRLLLADLREKYGEHPVLLETEADFTDEPCEQVPLYHEALRLALAAGWQTFSIRLSLAGVLFEMGQPEMALKELLACQHEMSEVADDREKQDWQDLKNACTGRLIDRKSR